MEPVIRDQIRAAIAKGRDRTKAEEKARKDRIAKHATPDEQRLASLERARAKIDAATNTTKETPHDGPRPNSP